MTINLSKSIDDGSSPSTHQTNPSVSIESLESNVQNVIKILRRRQIWKNLFNPTNHLQNTMMKMNRSPWQTHLISFLESKPAHFFTISLILIDLVFTTLELTSSLISCSSPTTSYFYNHRVAVEAWFHWLGISILSLLAVKTVALAVGLGGGSFFKQAGNVVDAVVVTVALVLEVFVEGKGGGVLMVGSLWRVVRVVEAAFELSDHEEAIEGKIEEIVEELEILKDENRKLKDILMEKEKVIQMLMEELD